MVFNFDPGAYHATLKAQGYIHLRKLLSSEFLAHLQSFLDEALRASAPESDDWKIAGKKRQFVYEFPSPEAAEAFRRGMARLTGIPEADFTISERHLKVYDAHATAYPAPHKDRSASHYSIGLPVHLPKTSTVCLFPDLDPGANTEAKAVFLASGSADEIRALYDSPAAHMLNERLGDVVVFRGSALFHERVNGAGTAVLYIKANGAGEDPLGENIFATPREVA